MIECMNKNPLSSCKIFKKYINFYLSKNEVSFEIKKSTLADIYYPWQKSAKILSCYSIYNNHLTLERKEYLRDVENILLYEPIGKSMYWHDHIIWTSPFFIKRIKNAPFICIDGTFITTKEY